MSNEIFFTVPTLKILTVADYKERVNEILFWQIKETFTNKISGLTIIFQSKSIEDFLLSLLVLAWTIITLPFTLVYFTLCLIDLMAITILLPLYLIPVVRILPITVETLIWSLSIAIGAWSGAALVQE